MPADGISTIGGTNRVASSPLPGAQRICWDRAPPRSVPFVGRARSLGAKRAA